MFRVHCLEFNESPYSLLLAPTFVGNVVSLRGRQADASCLASCGVEDSGLRVSG